MKVVINPVYKNELSQFVMRLPKIFDKEGEMVYQARNTLKRFTYDGFDLTVKRYKIPMFINRVAYTFFRSSKACRAYEYALILLSKGIKTPDPVAYIEIKRNGLFYEAYFISMTEPYAHLMREFYFGIEGREEILDAFAAFTVKVHESGVLHLDYSPGNIMFDVFEGEIRFSLLDLNRMKFGKLSKKECLRNFERLTPNEAVMTRIVSRYARLRGWNVEQSVREALAYEKTFDRLQIIKNDRKNKMKKKA